MNGFMLALQGVGERVAEAWRSLQWWFRKWFWIVLSWFKAAMNKPLVIPMPPAHVPLIKPVPLGQAIPEIPIKNILVCPPEHIPVDERSLSKQLFFKLQLWLYKVYPPMQARLPSISRDPDQALHGAYTWLHRKTFGPPVLPAEYLASPDLGGLAQRGPYACYTRRVGHGQYEWDFSVLSEHEHHEGLLRLGAKVTFEVQPKERSLRAVRIDCSIGSQSPGDAGWELAKKLALCSATTHLSLVRHFNGVHLAGSAPFSIATRNRLSADHPLMRLLWPYIYATEQSNDTVTRGQMVRGGDFECMFSYRFEGMCALFDATYAQQHWGMNDPLADAQARGVLNQGFDTPTEDNLAALFQPMLDHASAYLSLQYPEATPGSGTAGLRADHAVTGWLDELNTLVPGGVGVTRDTVTLAHLARLVAQCMYMASVQHEIVGGFLWNYQLWTHRQPIRVYASGQPEPLDVYQRVVNANYILNVNRRSLLDDVSYLALNDADAATMRAFQERMRQLQTEMAKAPWAAWKLYPDALKVNINA